MSQYQENFRTERQMVGRTKVQKERRTEGWSDLNSQDHLKNKELKRIMQDESKKACKCQHMVMDEIFEKTQFKVLLDPI